MGANTRVRGQALRRYWTLIRKEASVSVFRQAGRQGAQLADCTCDAWDRFFGNSSNRPSINRIGLRLRSGQRAGCGFS